MKYNKPTRYSSEKRLIIKNYPKGLTLFDAHKLF